MENDVILNKVSVIERCKNRILEVYDQNPDNLKDYAKQDSIILNVQRACEACIDLAMHIVANERLGLPQNSRDAFDILHKHTKNGLSLKGNGWISKYSGARLPNH